VDVQSDERFAGIIDAIADLTGKSPTSFKLDTLIAIYQNALINFNRNDVAVNRTLEHWEADTTRVIYYSILSGLQNIVDHAQYPERNRQVYPFKGME